MIQSTLQPSAPTGLHVAIIMDGNGRWATAQGRPRTVGHRVGTRAVDHTGAAVPDVDLLIRTGGEQRLSDFLLWECAYAELFFTRKMWPDFTPADLEAAVQEFRTRARRFGRVTAATPV